MRIRMMNADEDSEGFQRILCIRMLRMVKVLNKKLRRILKEAAADC